ncbi:MAG TPA: hypothetical protein VJ829_01385, partial [Candidatus Binatia bacterium]|nr:hypothetical protein [Candidatus Binatia bacterium]
AVAGPSPSGCQDSTLDGMVAADGNTLTAMERDYVRLFPGALTVQLRAPSGVCWETQYDATGVVTNEAGKFKARSR